MSNAYVVTNWLGADEDVHHRSQEMIRDGVSRGESAIGIGWIFAEEILIPAVNESAGVGADILTDIIRNQIDWEEVFGEDVRAEYARLEAEEARQEAEQDDEDENDI